ncbi:MAG: glycosyltransferase family 4 protein [Dehalococcoidia bacterium]
MNAAGAGQRPLCIAVLTSVHPPGDTRVFYREARSAVAAGHDVHLVAPGAMDGTVEGVHCHRLLRFGGRPGRPLRWPVLFWKAWRLGADVYHIHDPELLPWAVLFRWARRRPVIYDCHEFVAEDIRTKHWIPRPLRRPLAAAFDRFEGWAARRLDGVIAVTEEMADRFRRVQPETVLVRNLPALEPLPDPAPARQPVVIHSGLMNAERGLAILEETARLVRERHPEARFVILGPVEWFGVPARLRDMPADGWAAVGVEFAGTVPYPEVHGRLLRAAIGWLPRNPTARNNLLAWPNKLAEYMAAALPVVASDLPTQGRVVREEACGIAVEPMSPHAHAGAICRLLDDPAEARRLGENGRRAAAQRYNWASEARTLLALYSRLAGQKAR